MFEVSEACVETNGFDLCDAPDGRRCETPGLLKTRKPDPLVSSNRCCVNCRSGRCFMTSDIPNPSKYCVSSKALFKELYSGLITKALV